MSFWVYFFGFIFLFLWLPCAFLECAEAVEASSLSLCCRSPLSLYKGLSLAHISSCMLCSQHHWKTLHYVLLPEFWSLYRGLFIRTRFIFFVVFSPLASLVGVVESVTLVSCMQFLLPVDLFLRTTTLWYLWLQSSWILRHIITIQEKVPVTTKADEDKALAPG